MARAIFVTLFLLFSVLVTMMAVPAQKDVPLQVCTYLFWFLNGVFIGMHDHLRNP